MKDGSTTESEYQIFQLTPQGVLTTLHQFTSTTVSASLLEASDGNIYCTDVTMGHGSIFRLNLNR